MKVIKRTFLTAAVLVFSLALCLLSVVLSLAACSEKVTLRFETFGGTFLESVEGKVGTAYTVPKEPLKEGYYFEGWYLSSDFSGSPQELPASMPEESRTYYAKYGRYPVLTILPEGGKVAKTTHLIKPGVNLNNFLREFEPQKEGLVFGGWYEGEEEVDENRLMQEYDLTLTARYKAKYEVNVFLQNADEPEKFEKSEALSLSGLDWEGEKIYPEFTPPEHFYEDTSQKGAEYKVLSAGENTLNYYYLRQKVTFTYTVSDGEEEQTFSQESRYGAKVCLPESPLKKEGDAFFGWADEQNAPAKYLPDDVITANERDEAYFGTWGKSYPNVRGEGALIVENGKGEKAQAYFHTNSDRARGAFQRDENTFHAEGLYIKLDGRGGCLLDDSGSYTKRDLRLKSGGQTLTLDFKTNGATLSFEGGKTEGSYAYEFDEVKNAYTGKYLFVGKDESFRFALDEEEKTYLRQGAETGVYELFDGKNFQSGKKLTLDGFGYAEADFGGEKFTGKYLGSGADESEWLFEGEKSFKFLTILRTFRAGEKSLAERGFAVFDESLFGNFEGSGKLSLDGYGIFGEYVTSSGEKQTGAFAREGDFVTLYAEKPLKFTLRGSAFYKTGEEAGSFSGERGELYLDGAGRGKFTASSGFVSEGSYQKLPSGEIEFTPAVGESLRLKISEGGYEIFDASLFGTFEGSYTARLYLDGYGSGVYTSIDSASSFPIKVLHFDGEFLEIEGESLTRPLNFRIGDTRELYLLQGAGVGKYLIEGSEGDYLFLYDGKSAKLVLGKETKRGNYTLDEKGNVAIVLFEEGSEKFLLKSAPSGASACVRYTGEKSYEGMGKLTLNGFGGGVYENGESISGSYRLTEGGAELNAGAKTIVFSLEGDFIKEKAVYFKYGFENKVLLLEEGGERAVFQEGEREVKGSYRENNFLSEGNVLFSFQTFGESFAFYDAALDKNFRLSGGGTLVLDGCGGAKLTRGDILAEGKATFEGELLIFTSPSLQTLKKARVFKEQDGELVPLGEEYGTYICQNEVLIFDGEGGALYCGERGVYKPVGDKFEYILTFEGERSLRVRILFEEGEGRFQKYNEKLAALSGVFDTPLGTLFVSGYEVSLKDGDGNETRWEVISANGAAFVAKSQGGTTYLFTGGNLTAAYQNIEVL